MKLHEISLKLVHSAGSLSIVLYTSACCVSGLQQDPLSISKLCFIGDTGFNSPAWYRNYSSTIAVRFLFGYWRGKTDSHSPSCSGREELQGKQCWCFLKPGAGLGHGDLQCSDSYSVLLSIMFVKSTSRQDILFEILQTTLRLQKPGAKMFLVRVASHVGGQMLSPRRPWKIQK